MQPSIDFLLLLPSSQQTGILATRTQIPLHWPTTNAHPPADAAPPPPPLLQSFSSAMHNATKKRSFTYVVRASPPALSMWLCTGNLGWGAAAIKPSEIPTSLGGIVDKMDGWCNNSLTTFLKHSQKFCKKLSKTNKQTNKQRGVSHTCQRRLYILPIS